MIFNKIYFSEGEQGIALYLMGLPSSVKVNYFLCRISKKEFEESNNDPGIIQDKNLKIAILKKNQNKAS